MASPALTFTSPPDGYRASHGSHGDGEEGHSHDDPLGHMPSAVAVLVALTVHSLLEGLAIGVQSSVDSTFVIAAAVLLHKGFAAFALGAAFRSVSVSVGSVLVVGKHILSFHRFGRMLRCSVLASNDSDSIPSKWTMDNG